MGPWTLRTVWRAASGRSPGPGAFFRSPLGPRAVSSPSTPSTTLMIAFCCLREISSRLHRSCAFCGELAYPQVTGLSTGDSHVGNQGTNPGLDPQSPTGLTVVHRRPPVIHRISTGFVPRPVYNVGTLPCRCPQSLQQEIHTRPQAVNSEMTLCACPHRFPQGLSTSVGFTATGYPPLGINPGDNLWTRVENVGTKRFRPDVDFWCV